MCVVSMITEHYWDKWYPCVQPQTLPWNPAPWTPPPTITIQPQIAQEEVAEFKRLLERARDYDTRNHEPACQNAEKVAALKTIAKALNIDISFVDELVT